MATRKLRYFEYAGHSEGQGVENKLTHLHDAFETPNGFAFVVAGENPGSNQGGKLAVEAVERLRYYLENEEVNDPVEAVRNAMFYINGYMHVMLGRQPDMRDSELSCLCVLVREKAVAYAWVGQVCLFLFEGKKLIPLNWDVFPDATDGRSGKPWQLAFLGQQQFLQPGVCHEAYVPMDNDILLMGSSGFCLDADEKNIRKVLSDSMPTHTKAIRLIGQAAAEDYPAACQLVQFYNLSHESRSFVSGTRSAVSPPGTDQTGAPSPVESGNPFAAFFGRQNSLLKKIGLVVVVLLLAYMAYDLFLFNPVPSHRVKVTRVEAEEEVNIRQEDSLLSEEQAASVPGREASGGTAGPAAASTNRTSPAAQATTSFPADVMYRVKTGDTWGKIYSEFGVCSWFIRNHAPNSNKFDAANNPVAGSTLAIPVMYSSRQRLNPNYYTEFTIDKLGSSCQNANNTYLENFKQKAGR